MHRDVVLPGKNKRLKPMAKTDLEQGERHSRGCEEKAIRARGSPDMLLFRDGAQIKPQGEGRGERGERSDSGHNNGNVTLSI